MGKTIFSWFSSNDDGEVHRYPYTEEDDITKGHGHSVYDSMDDFLDDDPSWERDKDDPNSIDRPWEGNGYTMTVEELKNLKEEILSSKYYSSSRLLFKK